MPHGLAAHRRSRIHRLAHRAGVPRGGHRRRGARRPVDRLPQLRAGRRAASSTARSRTPTRWRGARPARDHGRRPPGRAEVRRRLGRAAAGVLPRERDRHPGAAGGGGRARDRRTSCSPAARPGTARRTPRSWTRTPRRAPESPYGQSKVDRRVAAARRRGGQPGAQPLLAALLQRGRLGPGRAGRPQPAQPVPQGVPRAVARARRRWCSAPTTTRPTARACATTCTWSTWPTRTWPWPSTWRPGKPAAPAYNVGRGEGSSVLEVVGTILRDDRLRRRARAARPAAGRPGPDRGRGGPDRRRPGLARPLRPGRHGHQRLGRLAAPARGPRRRARPTARGWTIARA